MKRSIGGFILLMLLIGQLPLALSASLPEKPQPFFKVNIMVEAREATIGNSSTWLGIFRVHVVLVDQYYRGYFDDLANVNETKAREEFKAFVRSLIYENLRDNFEKRMKQRNVTGVIYLPSDGPVTVLDNWSAVVRFSITNFLVPQGFLLECPLSGSMKFVIRGHVLDFSWDRLTLVLPRDYEVKDLAPAPDEFEGNVAVWKGGYIFPIIQIYSPAYSLLKFINSTEKRIDISFDPGMGLVQFNATFLGEKPNDIVKEGLVESFKSTMDITSIDVRDTDNGVLIIGVAKPDVAHYETRTEKTWKVVLKLPGKFDEVSVSSGTYQLAPDNTLIITITEKKFDYRILVVAGLVAAAGVSVLVIKKRKTGGRTRKEGGLPKGE